MCHYFSKAEDLLASIPSIYSALASDKLGEPDKIEETKVIGDKERLEICNKIKSIGVEIYENLNLSVIHGSYVKNSKFEDKITIFNKTLVALDTPGDTELYNCINDCFTKVLVNSLKQYQYLTHQLHVRNNNPDKLFLLYDFKPETLGNYDGGLNFDINPHADLFFYNILISILDRDFGLETKTLRELFRIRYELQKHTLKEDCICELLIDKCNLLIFKFIPKYDSEEYFRYLSISHDFEDFDIDLKNTKVLYLTYFKDIISNIYPEKKEENYDYLKKYYQEKNGKAETFEDFFIFVNFYRKIGKNITDIDSLIESFKVKFTPKNDSSSFHKRSYNISLNYLFNNKISLLSKQKFDNTQEIDNLLSSTKNLQDKTGVYNFFPYYKIAQCYKNYLEYIINEDNLDNYITIAQQILSGLGESIKLLKQYLEKGDLYGFLPFRPNFGGCCCQVNIKEESINVFIASAYVIPANFKKYNEELSVLESDYQALKTIVATQEFINTTKKKTQLLIEETSKKIDSARTLAEQRSKEVMDFAQEKSDNAINIANDSQKNNIQILSVFAALVVFAMGNFQVYRMVNTFQEALVFTLILAYSLCLFSIVIWFIVSKKKEEKMSLAHKIICGILATGSIVCACAIFWGIGKNTPVATPSKPETAISDTINIGNISTQEIVYPQYIDKKKKDSILIENPKRGKLI